MPDCNDCSYTCPTPPGITLCPNSDISGRGVIIGFVTTAYMAVLALVVYYFLAHDPCTDPFEKPTDGSLRTIRFRPTPVDKLALGRLAISKNPRIAEALSNIIFTMADIQILTGFAVLISAFASLHCGLQAYHWQIIVYLAWFSSLTHLAALTTVRQQLNYWHGMRFWRLFAMFLMAVMLIVALIPTANFDWLIFQDIGYDHATVNASDYVVCLFTGNSDQDPISYFSMIVSILVISSSFLTRLIRLYPRLSERSKQLREFCSKKAVQKLRSLHRWSLDSPQHNDTRAKRHHKPHTSLFRGGIYYAACAWYLLLRASLDICASLLWEMIWLIYAVIWGSLHLFLSWKSSSDGSSNNWSFGQIVPLILLAAPFVNALEYFFPAATSDQEAESTQHSVSNTSNNITIPSSSCHQTLPDFDLDHDFYVEFWFKCLISMLLLLSLELVIFVSIGVGGGTSLADEFTHSALLWMLLVAPAMAYCFTLFSVMVSHMQTGPAKVWLSHKGTQVFLLICLVMLTVVAFVLFSLWIGG